MKPKVILIGLDGARMDLLVKWCKQGHMPNLNKIIGRGVCGKLETILPIHSFPAWTSLSTGTVPSKHGIYDILLRRNPGEYERIPPNSNSIGRVQRFWEILDASGYTCAVINVPVTYPPKPPKNGIIVSSVLTPSTSHTFAYPKKVLEMLRNKKYEIMPEAKPGTDDYINEVHQILEKQYNLVRWIIKKHNWDCILWVIMSTEMLHHHYASFIDEKHPLYNRAFERVVRRLYAKIDTYIADLLNDIPDDVVFLLVSDHGFAPYYGTVYMNAYLKRWGFLHTKNKIHFAKHKLLNMLKESGKGFYKHLPKRFQKMAIDITGFGASEFTLDLIDWTKTKAYVAMLDGHIYVNLRGREKNGIVEKEEYECVMKEIIDRIINDQQLNKVIEEARKKGDVYRTGEFLDYVSDIFLVFRNANQMPFKIRTDPFAKNLINYRLTQFKENIGYHTLHGALIAHGKNIKQGYRRDASILDIAPTVLAIFGIEPQKYVDGTVLNDIFVDSSFLKASPSVRFEKV